MKSFALIAVTICSAAAAFAEQGPEPSPARSGDLQRELSAQKKSAAAANLEIQGEKVFSAAELRAALDEQLATIHDFGLTPARADDTAFFLELFYRKHGYAKVDVRYRIEGSRLVLEVDEGQQVQIGNVNFTGNEHLGADDLRNFALGPTREHYSRLQQTLPFIASDLQEGADLVHRHYISEGFLDSEVEKPRYDFSADGARVDVTIPVHEGRQYFFGAVTFKGTTIYGAEALRTQMLDLLKQPYTDRRVDDLSRRLQAYFKARGYYNASVTATGDAARAVDAHVPVTVTVTPGALYQFGEVNVTGLKKLRPSYLRNRFTSLEGKTYSPDVIDEKFRALMRTGLFNILQINPVPYDGDELRLDIYAEEAKAREFGVSLGYGSYTGAIAGAQFADKDLFGFGRPLTTSVEVSQRGYKGEILYEDPYLLNTEIDLRVRVSALTFDYDGYSKFEVGGRIELSRKLTKQYELGVFGSVRHVEVTSSGIPDSLLGRTSYTVATVGVFHTLDLRDSAFTPSRGLFFNQTFDLASDVIGSQINYLRTTARASYFIPIGKTLLEIGARGGLVRPFSNHPGDDMSLPIDERFFIGGSNSVRSFQERNLGPHDPYGDPIGGEFYTVFNIEYTFPLFGDLQGAVFTDAGNLLPNADDPSFNDMRYALGLGLRYELPIGPIRLDYGMNPDPRRSESSGAFHFSFGFAF